MTKPPSRAARIRELLAHRGKRGATPRQIREALQDNSNGISTALANMLSVGKIDREGNRYFANAATFKDGRAKAATPKKPPRTAAAKAGREAVIAAVQRQARAKAAPRPHAPATAPLAGLTEARPTVADFHTAVEVKRPLRDALATDVADFIARGGQVQTFAMGETAHSIAERERQAKAFHRDRSEIHPNKRAKRAA